MDANSLEIGVTYYQITYADVAQTMPGVEPMVYAGMNLFDPPSDGSTRYYFQDTVSVVRFGLGTDFGEEMQPVDETSELSPDNDEERLYYGHEAQEIGVSIVDLLALPTVIDGAIQRAKALGFPKLSKAKGKWV